MDSSVYTTSVRDKIILVALIVFGVCSFVTLWIGKATEAVIIGVIGSIITGLFGIYKGHPSTPTPPAITEQTTTSSVQTQTESGDKQDGQEVEGQK